VSESISPNTTWRTLPDDSSTERGQLFSTNQDRSEVYDLRSNTGETYDVDPWFEKLRRLVPIKIRNTFSSRQPEDPARQLVGTVFPTP
jgi:hypothetical protein